MDPLFPVLPENLSDLSDEELSELRAQHQDVARRVGEQDADLIGERATDDVLAQMTDGVAALETIKAEQQARADALAEEERAETERQEQIRALAEAAADPVAEEPETPAEEPEAPVDPEPEADPEAEPVDPEPETPEAEVEVETPAEEPVAVAASGKPAARRVPRRAPAAAPKASEPEGVAIVAAGDLRGISAGSRLGSMRDVAKAMIEKHDAIKNFRGEGKFHIATLERKLPEDRVLRSQDNMRSNMGKIDSLQAVVASGGICAPPANFYDRPSLVTNGTPVIDSLPSFNADRGGIQFPTPLTLADIDDAVGIVTETEDGLGGTNALKSCQVLDCPDFDTVTIQAVYQCLEFGNMGSRAWPENVEHITEQTMAAHARLRETAVLDVLAASSTHVTSDASVANVGMIADFVTDVIRAAAMYRSRHRMDPNARLRVVAPAWARDMAISDVVRSQFYREDAAAAYLADKLALANVNVTWYIDTPTGAGQVGAAQSAAEINMFPTTVVWYIFHEGAFLYLDGGTLDLGLVRDSTLNSTNDYQVFAEVFENVAFTGVESLQVTSTLHDTGATGGPVAIPATD